MINRSRSIPLAALVVLGSACSDGAPAAPKTPTAPPPPPFVLGTIQGTVDGDSMTATFTPLGGSSFQGGTISPATYGNQSTTLAITGVLTSMDSVPHTSKTWHFQVRLRNLEGWPIGSNSGLVPAPDTSGIFMFFTIAPSVTLPVGCACTVTVSNEAGTATFTAPNQKYFWYNSRPTAVQGTIGTDTTKNNPIWDFKTTYGPAPKDTAHAFTFSLLASAAWPYPHDTSWHVLYDGTQDTLPDVNGKPHWRRFAVAQDPTLGTRTWTAATQLVLSAGSTNTSEYFARRDSMGNRSAVLEAMVKISNGGSTTYQAIFGLTEPAGGRQAFFGMSGTRVGFVNFANGSGAWSGAGTSCNVATCGAMTGYHRVRMRKFGIDSVQLCVDGFRRGKINYPLLQASDASFSPSTVVFGVGHAAVTSTWQSVQFTIGTDGGSC